jgi:preprotein translocase subunit SecE
MQKINKYIAESIDEMRNKVTWPSYKSLQNSSILVLVASLIFALLIGLIDTAFKNSLEWFYQSL